MERWWGDGRNGQGGGGTSLGQSSHSRGQRHQGSENGGLGCVVDRRDEDSVEIEDAWVAWIGSVGGSGGGGVDEGAKDLGVSVSDLHKLPGEGVDREAFGQVGRDGGLDIGMELGFIGHGKDMGRNELGFWDTDREMDDKMVGGGGIKGRGWKILGEGCGSCQGGRGGKVSFGRGGLGVGSHCGGDDVVSERLKKVRRKSKSVKIGTSVMQTEVG